MMKRVTAIACATVATMLMIFGCGETSVPTRPSPLSPPASVSVAGLAQAMPVIASWSCLTQRAAGTPGIFAGGVRDAACPAQSHVTGFDAALDAPGAPPNLTASVTSNTVTLMWLVPTSPDPAASYVIEAGSFAGSNNIAAFDTLSTATSFTASAVPPGTYFIRVRARNSAGTSAASNEVVAVVGGGSCAGAPNAPSGLTSSVSGSSVSFSWNAPAAGCAPTGYVIEAGSTPGSSNLANFSTGSTATTFSATSVPAGTFYLRVRGSNGLSAGGPSNEITVVVGGGTSPPGPVTGRWAGVMPEGIIVELDPYDQCPAEYDLHLDLTSTGTAVTGTAITRLRRVEAAGDCSNVLGEVATWSVTNGRLGSGTISFALGNAGTFRFSGTFTAARMTGTVVLREFTSFSQSGSFVVNRQ